MTKKQLDIVRTSERKAFARCPQRWWWAYREGLVSNKPPSNPLWFGTGIHYALEQYYRPGFKRGPHPAETWIEWSDGEVRKFKELYGDTYAEGEYIDMLDLGTKMLEGYVLHWGADEAWEILSPEYSADVVIPTFYDDTRFVYGFTLDAVYRDHKDNGEVKLLETKTAASISTTHLALEPQAKSYLALAPTGLRAKGIIGPKDKIQEITYNFLRKGTASDRPRNAAGLITNLPQKKHYVDALSDPAIGLDSGQLSKLKLADLVAESDRHGLIVQGDVSKVQPPPLFLRHPETVTRGQARKQVEQIRKQHDVMRQIRDGYVPLWKVTVDSGPTACTGCQFFDLCVLDDMGDPDDTEEFKALAYHQEDPYASHREVKSA